MKMSVQIVRAPAPPSQRARKPRGRDLVGRAAVLWLALAAIATCVPVLQAQTLPVSIADFNHDGIPDVLVQSITTPTATIVFGSVPYGSFNGSAKAVNFPAPCTFLGQGSVLVGDLNGDGFPDIVFICQTSTGVLAGTMLGNGDGTFGAAATVQGVYSSTAVLGDFNQDGKLDLAVIGPSGSYTGPQGIEFFAGNGDGTFAAPVVSPFLAATFYASPVAVDVNGDGYPDLVLGNFASMQGPLTIDVFGNNKNGTFGVPGSGSNTPSASTSVGAYPTDLDLSILPGTFFGTGNIDFAVVDASDVGPGFFIVQNTSTATSFSLGAAAKTPYPSLRSGMAGSFTGSGLTDLVAANGSNLTVLTNGGSGVFTASYAALTLPSAGSLFAVADANADGYADVYTATQTTGLQVAVNLVTGSATATSQPFSLTIGTKPISAAWPGNVNFTGTTATGNQTVIGVPTVATLTSSLNPSTVGAAVTFTAIVAPTTTSPNVPSGMIVLTDGTTTLASGLLDATGKFSYTTSALVQATHPIQATYAGDAYFAGTLSPVLQQVVNHAPAVAPNLTWATPAPIVFGTALSATQLNAVATNAAGALVPGTFAYLPVAGTVLTAGAHTLSVTFTPTDPLSYLTVTTSVTLTITQATPNLTWATPAGIAYGIPLSSTQLNASVTGITGAALPGTLTYTPAAGAILVPGTQTLTVNFVPTDALDYTGASGSVRLVVSGITLTSFTPNTANLGDPNKTITLTGLGFVSNSVVQVNGTAVPTTFVNPTTLTAIIPTADFALVGTLQIAAFDPAISLASTALPLTVAAIPPTVTLSGPPTTAPGSQPSLSFAITNPYPVPLTVTFTLSFAPAVTPAVDDPAIQFSNGSRTFSFVVAANSVAVPPIQLQSGTIAGTITIPIQLVAGGAVVTPASLQPVVIVVPAAIPSVTSTSITRSGDQLTVVMDGFSNTREVTQATFHFIAAPGDQVNTPDITLPVGTIFASWFSTPPSDPYGSTFSYTQIFNVSGGATNVGSVQITLTNTVGVSTSQTAQ